MAELAASVIVCTRNRANYLNRCLESLLLQECQEKFEIVVVDNGSTDGTPQFLSEWCSEHAHFRSVLEARIGLSSAKNAGAQSAQGRLLIFTDDDVLLEPHWLQSYLDLFARIGERNTMAGGPIVPILDDLSSWPDWFDVVALPEAGLLDHKTERPLLSWEYVWGANMVIPSSVFRSIGLWNEEVGRKGEHRGTFEDTEYQDRLRAAGGTVWFCPNASLKHRVERDRIRPYTVISRAFARGRNEFLRDLLRTRGTIENPPREGRFFQLLTRLALQLTAWVRWTVVFSLIRNRVTFREVHAAAFWSGKSLERVRAGRESDRLTAWIGRGVFLVRRAALGLIQRMRY